MFPVPVVQTLPLDLPKQTSMATSEQNQELLFTQFNFRVALHPLFAFMQDDLELKISFAFCTWITLRGGTVRLFRDRQIKTFGKKAVTDRKGGIERSPDQTSR